MNANAGVRDVLEYLRKVKATGHILAGQHVYLESEPDEMQRVRELTGRFPALVEFDLLGFQHDPERIEAYLALAKTHAEAGGLIGVSWHETSPALAVLDEGGYEFGTKKAMSQAEFDEVLKPGTLLHRRWLEHVDAAAAWLDALQEAGIPVLWRPYHEMTGGWFWWGAKTPASFCRLWRALYERLTHDHRLDHLIWVWSAAQVGSEYAAYCPRDYVDVGGVDLYRSARDDPTFTRKYAVIREAVGTSPVALTEVGLLPYPEVLLRDARYVWFTLWGRGFLDSAHYGTPAGKRGNLAGDVTAFYAHPGVLTRDDVRDWLERER